MISNERPFPAARQLDFQRRLPVPEIHILHREVQIGRRSYAFALNENTHGPFLRITESADNGVNSIIVPDIRMELFRKLTDEMVVASHQEPPAFVPGAGLKADLLVYERTLKTAGLDAGWKSFLFALIEDYRGRYLQITEKTGSGRHISLIISADGLEAFQKQVTEMALALSALPSRRSANRVQTPAVRGNILKSMKIRSERKSIMLMLKESPRGRLLRLTEKAGERFACVVIPADLMEKFSDVLNEIIQASDGIVRRTPWAATETLKSEQLQTEEKTFILNLEENGFGRYMRLVEDQGDYGQKWINLPVSILREFKMQIDEMMRFSSQVAEESMALNRDTVDNNSIQNSP